MRAVDPAAPNPLPLLAACGEGAASISAGTILESSRQAPALILCPHVHISSSHGVSAALNE